MPNPERAAGRSAFGSIEPSGARLPNAYSCPDTVEEVRSCQRLAGLIQSGPGDRSWSHDGGTPRPAGCAVLRVLARTTCAGEALAAVDRSVRRIRWAAAGIGAVLQRDGAAIDRSGAADPDADRRLLLRHPLGAAAVRGSAPQPSVPLVLWIGS